MKIIKIIQIFFFLFLVDFIQAQYTYNLQPEKQLYLPEWKYNIGDHLDWVKPDFNDTEWKTVHPIPELSDQKGIHFYRCGITIKNIETDPGLLAIGFLNLGNAFEIYWDGRLIGQNGQVGNSKSGEDPGNHILVTKLDKEFITPDRHTLVIRCSNFHGRAGFLMTKIILMNWDQWYYYKNFMQQYTIFTSGILITVAILGLALFIGLKRKKDFIFLVVYALFSMVLIYINYRDIIGVPTTYDFLFLFQNILFHLVNILLVGYFIIFLKIPIKIFHFSLIAFVLSIDVFFKFVLSVDFDLLLTWIFLIYTSGILIYSMKRKITGSVILFIGFSTLVFLEFLTIIPVEISIMQFHILNSCVSVFLLFCMVVAICKRLVEQEKQHEEVRIKAHRLENEMLKKTIQPHFIMNTLLSLMQLILKNPRKAIQLVQLLAEEFKLINQFSSKKLITMKEELRLCKTHLDLMSLRKKTNYELNTKNIESSDKIPPMIFHTLIENGLTHALKADENGSFQLSSQKDANVTRYVLTNNGSRLEELQNQTVSEISEGLGIHYVKARLEESFGDGWNINYGLKNNRWKVEICIEN